MRHVILNHLQLHLVDLVLVLLTRPAAARLLEQHSAGGRMPRRVRARGIVRVAAVGRTRDVDDERKTPAAINTQLLLSGEREPLLARYVIASVPRVDPLVRHAHRRAALAHEHRARDGLGRSARATATIGSMSGVNTPDHSTTCRAACHDLILAS